MSKLFFSKLRVFILIILSICVTSNSMAMAVEMTMSEAPAMTSHCAEMMGDVQASSLQFLMGDHHEKNTCGDHYACFGLELKSIDLSMNEIRTATNVTQSASPYQDIATVGYFALPDPPPRYTS